ncbi:hypothetical protein LZD49_28600 [Dyadobacter sp. CY261]|uniref:tail completion protein gp17 n=1 Tax=Dyadobacter sp. CY261 TaxID=2907203 RepID=UPI001F359D6F|nr:DUF3168 domain-containing protein [Dyadobacter sp. CY261]MCF0074479.1 hypothetical protein [Dyadobacter sp. CY261]
MITRAFIQKLLATSYVTALVGTRVYPNVIKEDAKLPAVYVFADGMEDEACYDPQSTKNGSVEIGVLANSYQEVSNAMAAIRLALDKFQGVVSNVGIVIMSGREVTDGYDEKLKAHIKVVEYSAMAEQR